MVIVSILQNFGWLDLVDIIIVAYLIYQVILLLRGSRMSRLLAGLAALIACYLIAQYAGLVTVQRLLDNVLASLVIFIAVIYQHEIRRALFAFGRHTVPKEQTHDVQQVIEEVVSAADTMTRKKVGALIVIEREVDVNSFIEVGTEIDAKVTSELITSIFLPYSPIHDGAVIIQKGKLTRAGCFLPLSRNPGISKSLGTRHRAAIGLTERTDAIVVAVSEETSRISLVVEGRITTDLDQNSLRKFLRKLLEAKQGRWLK
jgi:uncharacterized protein (TIGR00159 family)